MSGIFGILNLGGKPVSRADLEAMRRAMDYWGPHGSTIWQDGNIGLGHLLLRNTPESVTDSQPLRHPPSGVVLTAHARIDNREELWSVIARSGVCDEAIPTDDQEIAHLHLAPQAQVSRRRAQTARTLAMTSDSGLILHAYLRWGEACVHHLLGDWAFALWDPRKRKLFLARDHFGISSLYYYRGADFLAFTSSIKALLALPQIPMHPNLLRVAQVLTSWPGDGTQTAYEGIEQLSNAHTMIVTSSGTEIRRYWDPADTPPLHLSSDDEYVEAFLEIYTEAVRCRLRTPSPSQGEGRGGGLGATISSGLDSGSVCALAARELRSRGKRLSAFTSIPIYPTAGLTGKNRYGDESPLVEINRGFIPNLDIEYIRAENFGPLAGIARDLEIHDSPMHSAGNMFWIYDLLEIARRQGLGVLLTGQTGNGSVSWAGGDPQNYWPLLLTGRWRALRQKAKDSPSLARVIRSHFLRPVVQPFRNQVARLRQVGHPPWLVDYAAIHPDFARALDLKRQMLSAGHDPYFIPIADPRQAQLHLFRLNSSLIGATWAEMGAAYTLEARDPTMDKRLIEFCLAIPQEQYRLNGQDRALIRRAMIGLLPDEVRLNTRRGRQAADVGHRLLAELPQVQALMAQLEVSELARTVLDLPKMQSVLAALQAEVNQETTFQTMTILTRGLMAGMFLLRFE